MNKINKVSIFVSLTSLILGVIILLFFKYPYNLALMILASPLVFISIILSYSSRIPFSIENVNFLYFLQYQIIAFLIHKNYAKIKKDHYIWGVLILLLCMGITAYLTFTYSLPR